MDIQTAHFIVVFQFFGVVLELLDPLPGALRDLVPGAVNHPRAPQFSLDFVFLRPVEHRRQGAEAQSVRRPTQVDFQHLPDVHAPRHAQRVQDNLDRSPILQIRHVFNRHNLRDDALIPVSPGHFVADRQLALLRHAHPHHLLDAGGEVRMFLTSERLHVHHLALLAMRQSQRRVFHLARLLAEDRPQQLLLRAKFLLALRRDLADQNVIRPHLCADAHDAEFVQVLQRLFADVGDVVGDFLRPQLGVARFNFVLLNVNAGELVLPQQFLADEQRIFVVAAIPRQERAQHVMSQRQVAVHR